MATKLSEVPAGAIIRHPNFHGYWEIMSQRPLLTCVRPIGSERLADFCSRDRVTVVELPEVEDLPPQPAPCLTDSEPVVIM